MNVLGTHHLQKGCLSHIAFRAGNSGGLIRLGRAYTGPRV